MPKLFNIETIFLDLFFFLCLNISQMVRVLFTDPNKMMFNDPNNWATQQIIQQFAVHNSLNSQFIALKIPFLCHFSWCKKWYFSGCENIISCCGNIFQDVEMFFPGCGGIIKQSCFQYAGRLAITSDIRFSGASPQKQT